MPDVFITLEEAAAFEGITYEAMKKRAQRSPKQYKTQTPGPGRAEAKIKS